MFDPKEFTERLRTAQAALDDVIDMIEDADEENIAPPGRGYLLARMHLAAELVEQELPEFKRAIQLTALPSLEKVAAPLGYQSMFRNGGTKL